MEFHACEPVTLSVRSLAAFLAFSALLGRFDTGFTSFVLSLLLGCLLLNCFAGLLVDELLAAAKSPSSQTHSVAVAVGGHSLVGVAFGGCFA